MNTIITIGFILACAGVFIKWAFFYRNRSQTTGNATAYIQTHNYYVLFSIGAIIFLVIAVLVAWAGTL
jgi:hypothetical protein